RGARGKRGPAMYPSHRIGVTWTNAILVIVREEFGLVRCHVDVDGAIALASLAGEAQIKCVEDFPAFESVADHIAMHHLEKKMCATASRVFFFHRRPVARAHRAFFLTPALADAYAAHCGVRKAPFVVNKVKMRRRFFRREVSTVTKVLRNRV